MTRRGKNPLSVVPPEFSKIVADDGTPLVNKEGEAGFLSPDEVSKRAASLIESKVPPIVRQIVAEQVANPRQAMTQRIDQLFAINLKIQESQSQAEKHASNASSRANLTNFALFGDPNTSDKGTMGRLEERVVEGEVHTKESLAAIRQDFKSLETKVWEAVERQDKKIDQSLHNQQDIINISQNIWGWLQQPGRDGSTKRISTVYKYARNAIMFFIAGGSLASIWDHLSRIGGVFKAIGHAIMIHVFGVKK